MTVNCPKCDADISDTYERDDPSVGIVGGWYCDACDLGLAEWEVGREPSEDDVPISFARKRDRLAYPTQVGQQVRPDPPDAPPKSAIDALRVKLVEKIKEESR